MRQSAAFRYIVLFLALFITVFNAESAGTGNEAIRSLFEQELPLEKILEKIRLRIKEIENSASIDERSRTVVLDIYQQALNELNRASEWKKKTVEFEQALNNAPALLATIKKELAINLPEPVITVPAKAGLAQLEQLSSQAESEWLAAQKRLSDLEDELKRRADQRLKIPELQLNTQLRLDDIDKKLKISIPQDEMDEVAEANQVLLLAQKRALKREIESYKQELLSYEARGELINARRYSAARQLTRTEKFYKAWLDIIEEQRRLEAVRSAEEMINASKEITNYNPLVQQMISENISLTEDQTRAGGLTEKITEISEEINNINLLLAKTRDDFKSVRSRVEVAKMSMAMGMLLAKKQLDMPDIRRYKRNVKFRQSTISRVQLKLIELEDERAKYADLETVSTGYLAQLKSTDTPDARAGIEQSVRKLLLIRRNYIETLMMNYEVYFARLIDLDSLERQLITELRLFSGFISEHILWMRTTWSLRAEDLNNSGSSLLWFFNPGQWVGILKTISTDITEHPAVWTVALVIFLLLLRSRRKLIMNLLKPIDFVPKTETTSIIYSINVLVYTFILSALWPYLIMFISWRLSSVDITSELTKAVASGMRPLAFVYLSLELIRQMCRTGGFAEVHFKLPDGSRQLIYRNLSWLMLATLPLVFIVMTIEAQSVDLRKESLGRLAFIVGQLALAFFVERVLRPKGEVMKRFIIGHEGGWFDRFRYVIFCLTISVPLALAGITFFGYYYTAIELEWRLQLSFWIVLGVMVLYALVHRSLEIARDKLILEQEMQAKSLEEDKNASQDQLVDEDEIDVSDTSVDVPKIDAHAKGLLHSVVVFLLIIGLWLTWVDVLPALGILNRYAIWTTTSEVTETQTRVGGEETVQTVQKKLPVTLADLALALVMVVMTIVISKNITGLLELIILLRLPIDSGARYAFSAVIQYAVLIFGIIIVLGTIGISWENIHWLVAAMTVGLGFGLQEIFANFISGLILFLERPVRVGDLVTVGEVSGRVSRIRMRATTITNFNRKELIVPNKEFITGQLVNWTLSDSILRVDVPVGIAYGSNTDLAFKLLHRIAKKHPHVLDEPKTQVLFVEFGESSLNFSLRVFIPSPDYLLSVRHDLHMEIDKVFRKAGIEIAFPQRDIHVRSIHQPIKYSKDTEQD